MKKKIIFGALALLLAGIAGVWFFVFFKPTHFKRDVADEKGISINAPALVKSYQDNEAAANTAYLDQSLVVSGEVAEVKPDQTGKTTITLKSNDAFAGVLCTLKTADSSIKAGDKITVKGICTGFLSDVVLKEGIIVK